MANVEHLKANSAALRGTLAEELTQSASGFSAGGAGILKFHGMYQQENRDNRQTRKQEAQGKAHSFMVRTRIPGGRVMSPANRILPEHPQARRSKPARWREASLTRSSRAIGNGRTAATMSAKSMFWRRCPLFWCHQVLGLPTS